MGATLINAFVPSLEQAIGLLALSGTLASFAIIGAALTGTRRVAGADILAGWGAVIFVFVIAGVFSKINLSWLAYGLFVCAAFASWHVIQRDRRHNMAIAKINILWRVLLLALPFLLLVAAMRASQWDEFSQWLPNAQFLFHYDAFPRSDLPKSPSVFPAYPYGLPLVTYLTSKLAGNFVENTSAIFNLLLLFSFSVILSNVITSALEKEKAFAHRWSLLALCMLGVTILSTTFVQKIVLTSYADSTTSVMLAVIAVLIWKVLNKLAATTLTAELKTETQAAAWQAGLVIAAFLFLKQTNLVLLVLLFSGFLVVALRDPAIRFINFIRLWPQLLLPGIIIYLAWRYHVSQHLAYGEISLLPFHKWLLGDAFTILAKMATIASKKAAYFILMFTIAVFALRGFIKSVGSTERLLIPIAVVFLGFNLFLWLMYIAVFGRGEGLRAASFWRYNIQLGLLGVTGAAYGLAMLWQRYISPTLKTRPKITKGLIYLPIILTVALPVALQHKLRFDIRPQKDHMRLAGQNMAALLPKNSALVVVDLNGVGFTGKVIRYELMSRTYVNKRLSVPVDLKAHHHIKKPSQFTAYLNKYPTAYVWIHQPLPLIETALRIKLAPYASHLLKRNKNTWNIVKSWPYDGYKDPHSLPD